MIICIGEIVWDIFGSQKVLGGAPLNVAYHLKAAGREVRLISRVGDDELGRAALEKIRRLNLPLETIQTDRKYPTGKVQVHLNEKNEPAFEILSPAAWDFIERSQPGQLPNKSYHLVFGTLAQRAPVSRATIRSLLAAADKVFYDVNLRAPHTTRELVLESLAQAQVGKMNEAELAVIGSWASLPPDGLPEMAQALLATFNLEVLALTLGGQGAMLVCPDGVFRHPGFPVQVADPVGAGDAFFAALIDGILQKRAWQECLVQANKSGAYVASQPGATPEIQTFQPETGSA
jgi:fructokinase